MSFTIIDNGRAIRCNTCGHASYSPNDIRDKYCSRCRKHHNYVGVTPMPSPAPLGDGYWPALNPVNHDAPVDRSVQGADSCVKTDTNTYDASPSSSDPVDYGSNDCGSGGWSDQ
ncbi:hypothetical protein [Paraburkholderia youngii]|uniref:hypothetical protein n=1 Tax=Paraburkholderia youngii TaxID=2782701 RepID=UPI0015904358|nr:hypothetical protein [Paraburkholderia youngii]NUX58699.1 hypothetical protein [Paraburkholderia youngii]